MSEEIITPEQLVSIINNTDKKYQFAGKDYILIIKDEPHRPCTLYIFDCEEAIWSKLFDLNFFSNLKRQLQLTSPLEVFAAHFVKSLVISSYLQKERSALKIVIELQIGEGLVMSASVKVETRVHYNNPDDFKKALRKFTVFLLDVKNSQLKRQKQKEEADKQERKRKEEEQQQQFRRGRASLSKKIVNNKNYIVKKGDLMNPERKKRKKQGAKLGTGYEQDMLTLTTPDTPRPSAK